MFVLTRKRSEVIRVGDDIRIIVLGYGDGQVRIGVDAPVRVKVHREEVYTAIQQEGEQK